MEVPTPGQSVISNSLIMARVYSFCDAATLAQCLRVSKGGFMTVCQALYEYVIYGHQFLYTDLGISIVLPEVNGSNDVRAPPRCPKNRLKTDALLQERLATYSGAVRSCASHVHLKWEDSISSDRLQTFV
jgi:hypothetical protein